jgi:IS5 family transposase
MPGKGKKKYSKKQMKIARVAEPRDRITRADFRKLKMSKKKRKV